MGSSPFVSSSGGGGSGGWWWHEGGGGSKNSSSVSKNGSNTNNEGCSLSSTFAYFLFSFVVLGSIGSLYAWFMLAANVRTGITALGCQDDNEGSWAIGIYYGDSPFSLKPIEAMNVWKDKSAAWPVANPVVTCASLSDSGFPSNFVADPFLYVQVISSLSLSLPFSCYHFQIRISDPLISCQAFWVTKQCCLVILVVVSFQLEPVFCRISVV